MFINMKVRNKIFFAVLSVVVLSLVSSAIISFVNIRRITDYSEQVNAQLTAGAVSGTEGALLGQAGDYINLILDAQVNLVDAYLSLMSFRVTAIENAVYNIFTYPQSHNGYDIIPSSEAEEGVFTSTWSLSENIKLTDEIAQEINLLSNLEVIIYKLAEYPTPLDLYVGMESGLLYTYSTRKFENTDYDPREQPWYKKAAEDPFRMAFTGLHESHLGAGQVITLSFSIVDNDYNLLGVAGMDIPLEDLMRLTSELRVANTGYMFILSGEGVYISHPDFENEEFTHFRDNEDVPFADGLRQMMNGERGYIREETDEGVMYLAFAPSIYYDMSTEWSVGLVVAESEILSAKEAISTHMDEITQTAVKDMSNMSADVFWNFVIVLAVSILVIFVIGMYMARFISEPIERMAIEKEMQEKLNLSKMAFLGNMSHELKTPLTVISNVSQLTALRSSDDYVKDKMNTAVTEVERMKNIVNRLLELSKAEDNEAKLNFQPTDLTSLLPDIVPHYFQVLDEHNNKLTIQCPEYMPFVKADIQQLTSVLVNLIHNAARFTRGGSITVGAVCGDNAETVAVFVEDTGCGMSLEQLEHIFDRFHTGNDSTGTGLGLYICKKIVETHGGTISIQSEPERGTKISFTLPVWEEQNK